MNEFESFKLTNEDKDFLRYFKKEMSNGEEAPIGPFVERNKDFAKAKEMGYEKNTDGTWHHHEDAITLQDIETILHK